MERVSLTAADGVSLQGYLWRARTPKSKCLLIAPAMGVRGKFYAKFAEFASEHFNVMTLDYRGLGDSKHGDLRVSPHTLADWALDLSSAADALRDHGQTLHFIGHSVGGQLMALMEQPPDTALFVASQSGHWRHWSGLGKAGMFVLWRAMPAVSTVMGRFPARLLGGGEDLPPHVAKQWARWGRARRYIGSEFGEALSKVTTPVTAIDVTDDPYAPKRAVDALVALLERAPIRRVTLSPSDFNVKSIGHFGLFTQRMAPAWPRLLSLLAESSSEAVG